MTKQEIQWLIDRNTPKAMKICEYQTMPEQIELCPECQAPIVWAHYKFCPYCGQALDRQNYAFGTYEANFQDDEVRRRR